MNTNKCAQCDNTADALVSWFTKMGHQRARMCGDCRTKWRDAYKNTPAGQSVTIQPLTRRGEVPTITL